MGRKVCILGMGPSASDKAADIDKYVSDCEVWSLNNAYNKFPGLRFSRYFELHSWDYLKEWTPGKYTDGRPVDHWESLKRLGCEVWVSNTLPVVPNQQSYPYLDIFRHFGAQSIYWLGSPSLMLALALYEHDNGDTIDEIRSYGIDTSDPQHGQQRQSWAWWLSKAQERGILISGTALAFQDEYERDEGLNGIREMVRDQIPPKAPKDEFVVVSAATESYVDKLEQLKADCKQHGLKFRGHRVETTENEYKEFEQQKVEIIKRTLHEVQKPVLWIDADDNVICNFGIPTEGWDIGIIQNPERKVIQTFLQAGANIAIQPNEKGYEFLNNWQDRIKEGINDHRALNIALLQPPAGLKIGHLDPYLRGAIRISPGSRNRPTMTT